MSSWCIFNYEQRRIVHYFLTLFTLLLAAIHWFDYLGGETSAEHNLVTAGFYQNRER